MEEILKELIEKFNACKADGLNYRTYKDGGLEEAFARAEKLFVKDEQANLPEPEKVNTEPAEAQPTQAKEEELPQPEQKEDGSEQKA